MKRETKKGSGQSKYARKKVWLRKNAKITVLQTENSIHTKIVEPWGFDVPEPKPWK